MLIALATCLFFVALGRLPLMEPDEGRNAEVAREMLVSGDWITPHFNSLVYLDKPAVYFWLVATSFRMVGISEYAARMPSALMGLGTLILTWLMARKMFGDEAGLRAGIIWATMPLVIIFSRTVIFDMTLTFLITLAMFAFWTASSSDFRRPWLEVVMFAACGLATITKGPVGFLLPLLSIAGYHALGGRFRELKRLRWGLGVAALLAASLPWFIAVSLRNPDFPRYAFWDESLRRFASGHAHRGGSIFYYIPIFLAGLLPWSFFLIFAGWNRIRRWKELREETHKPVLFALAWACLIFVFFTISQSKLPAYFLPATVPLSILMARAWEDLRADVTGRRPDWLTAGFAAMIALGALVALGVWEFFQFGVVRTRALEKMDPLVLGLVKPSLLYTGLIIAALGVLGRDLAERQRGRILSWTTFTLIALTAPVLLVRWIPVLRIYAEISSCRRLAQNILASPDKDLPIYGFHYFRTSLPFYLRRPVGLISADGSEMTSNYISMEFARYRQASVRGPASGSGGPPSPVNPQIDSPFNNLLMSDAEFIFRAKNSPRSLLVLARNNQAQLLMDTVPGENSPAGLWTNWQDSVWEIPASPPPRSTPK